MDLIKKRNWSLFLPIPEKQRSFTYNLAADRKQSLRERARLNGVGFHIQQVGAMVSAVGCCSSAEKDREYDSTASALRGETGTQRGGDRAAETALEEAGADYEVFRAAEEDESVIGRIVSTQREEVERELAGLQDEAERVAQFFQDRLRDQNFAEERG